MCEFCAGRVRASLHDKHKTHPDFAPYFSGAAVDAAMGVSNKKCLRCVHAGQHTAEIDRNAEFRRITNTDTPDISDDTLQLGEDNVSIGDEDDDGT